MLKQRIQEAMKSAMRGKDPSLGVIRLMLAGIKQKEVDERITLDDDQIMRLLNQMIKQRRDSKAQYQQAGRDDLVAQETVEIEAIQQFLPEPLSEARLTDLIQATIADLHASSIKDMGKVMGAIKAQVEGRADLKQVGETVKALLQN